ncbi:Na+ dependent nucleoside transporter [Paracrocinitomix mangrovi]|uniref:NupC/NupG family nucleoside CNT transporter n=1 Tax=Paracrocinitomix mangrovi TaxID=2862509 RepID=UPI001C8E26E1|nr:nucleoside transporter C-terminal domain-containing protein [Paracrocinitomix mangrovi]UKN00506.1 Na+ dependent nucleoside transporter [Paracrocinitomix mangrovi]
MKKLLPILLLGLLALVSSCSEDKADPLVGKWISENSQTEHQEFIIFTQSDAGLRFIEYGWYNDTIKGDWTRQGDSLSVTYFEPASLHVDSIEITTNGEGETDAHYFYNNQVIANDNDGEIQGVKTTRNLLISLNESNLSIPVQGKTLQYELEHKESKSLSFVSVLRGLMGMLFLIALSYLFSSDKKNINWNLVIKGTALQIIIALLVLKVPFIERGFSVVSDGFVWLIEFTDDGTDFLFGQMGIGIVQAPLITFAIKVLPTIIFFSALMSMLYYMGVIQKVVYAFAWLMKKFMKLSGAESLAAAGNVFLGQTESPLLVKPYLLGMTKSELMCLMTGGMATIAGGVLAAYVFFLGGDDPVERAFFAKHLLTASIISAPAAVVAAKILVPETEEINKDLSINKEKIGTNLLEAIANGTSDGLKLAVNVGAMLLVFIALMALGNGILDSIGNSTNLNDVIAANTPYEGLSFQFILGYIGAPIVWMVGVDATDMVLVGELLGQKTVLNEFIAYPRLGELKQSGQLSEKSIIISTYMLCGFANFASIGIQIGGIGSLIPTRKGLLSKLGMRALLGGTIACLMTAAIVGMLY